VLKKITLQRLVEQEKVEEEDFICDFLGIDPKLHKLQK